MRKPAFEIWEREANAAHNNKYANGYGKLKAMWDEIRVRDECPIDCPEHGEFLQQPGVHRKGHGCCECVGLKRFTTETIKLEFAKAHGNKYDYSLVEYVNMHTNVKIICPKEKHGAYEQLPVHHKRGIGCPACGGNKPYTTETLVAKFIEVRGNEEFDYSMVIGNNNYEPVKIRCKKADHIFEQTPSNHIAGAGCPECAGLKPHTNESIIAKFIAVHGDLYGYSLVEYIDYLTPIKMICIEDGIFEQSPSNHVAGQGCPRCLYKNQTRVEKALDKFGLRHKKIIIKANGRKYYPDFYFPDYNLVIEYNGKQHYGPLKYG